MTHITPIKRLLTEANRSYPRLGRKEGGKLLSLEELKAVYYELGCMSSMETRNFRVILLTVKFTRRRSGPTSL